MSSVPFTMFDEQTTKRETVEDAQREDNLSPNVMRESTLDTSKEPRK